VSGRDDDAMLTGLMVDNDLEGIRREEGVA